MRRLIADRRRNCAIISLVSLLAIAVVAVIARAKLIALNEQWRNEALALCSDLQENSSWLQIETEVVQDFENLSKKFMCDYDEAGSIGKRYRREDEIGTPYCVTVDFDTLEDDTVTIRDRDTMEQIRIKIDELIPWIESKLEF